MSTSTQLDLVCKLLLSTKPTNNVDIKTLSSVFKSIRSKALSEAVYPHLCGHLELLRTGNGSISPFSKDSSALKVVL